MLLAAPEPGGRQGTRALGLTASHAQTGPGRGGGAGSCLKPCRPSTVCSTGLGCPRAPRSPSAGRPLLSLSLTVTMWKLTAESPSPRKRVAEAAHVAPPSRGREGASGRSQRRPGQAPATGSTRAGDAAPHPALPVKARPAAPAPWTPRVGPCAEAPCRAGRPLQHPLHPEDAGQWPGAGGVIRPSHPRPPARALPASVPWDARRVVMKTPRCGRREAGAGLPPRLPPTQPPRGGRAAPRRLPCRNEPEAAGGRG